MDRGEIQKRVVRVVREKFAGADDEAGQGPFVLLSEEGIFDSVTALELVLAIEKEFSIVIKDDDVRPENLGSLESIVRFIQAALLRQASSLLLILTPTAYISMLSMFPYP